MEKKKENKGKLALWLNRRQYIKIGDAEIYVNNKRGPENIRVVIIADRSIPITRHEVENDADHA